MRFASVIELVAESAASDPIGQQVVSKTARRVFANEFAVSSSEFYDAAQFGLKPSRRFQIRAVEYDGERVATVDGDEYTVLRCETRGEWATLTLERKAANHG